METILKQALERCKMTQKELAEAIHVSSQAVSKWVNGESRPSVDNVIEINKVLGIDLIKEMTKNNYRGKKTMKQMDLYELNNYDMAKKEAKSILTEAQIETNYSHSVYVLCERLLTAVIGLTYHQLIHNKDEYDEYTYSDIFSNLEDYFDDECFEKAKGLFENHLEYSFYRMGGDLFESMGESKMINDDYCRDSMNEWYKCKRAVNKSPASHIYNELLVALTEIIDVN